MLQAISHAEGRPVPGTRVHNPKTVDVKALRVGIGMTQEQFATKFGVSTATLRHWERGDRSPHSPALVLLNRDQAQPQGRDQGARCLGQVPK